jgi:rod shape-determining protein MreC
LENRTRRRTILDIVIAVLLLVIPALFLHASFKNPHKLNVIDRGVLKISSPLQRGVSWIIDGIEGAWRRYVWLVDVDQENDELRKENDRLHRELQTANAKAAEADELEALVDLRARTPSQTVGARVVAVGSNPYFRVDRIVIDRGAGEVSTGMPVIAANGVVGRIARVYGHYADVTLATDSASAIDVYVPRTGSRGMLRGVGGSNEYLCRIDYLLASEQVKEGDAVVTSGLGGVFPRDVPVGRIKKIARTEYAMYQDATLEPAVDYSRLRDVLVILAPPPPPDPSAKQKKSPEPAFGLSPTK